MKLKLIKLTARLSVLCLVSFSLATSISAAATYYVNNSIACSDSNAGTAAGSPLCTIAAGYSKSAANDTILVTPGTYNVSTLTFSKGGQTWQRANTSAYAVLDYGGSSKAGIYINANDVTVDGFKLQNLKACVDGQFTCWGIFGQAVGGMTLRNNHITIPLGKDCLDNPRPANLDTCASYANTGCNSCNAGIGWQGYKVLVENNTIRGGFSFGMEPNTTYYSYNRCNQGTNQGTNCASASDCPGGSCVPGPLGASDPSDAGGTVRNNTLINDYSTGSVLFFLLEGVGRANKHGTYIFSGNKMDRPNKGGDRTWAFYTREVGAVGLMFFNNYAHNINTAIYFQEAYPGNCIGNGGCASENQAFFNNTFDCGANDSSCEGVHWGTCIDATIKNNLFLNGGVGMTFRGAGAGNCPNSTTSGGGGPLDSAGGGPVTNNLWYHTGANNVASGISYKLGSNPDVAVNLITPQFGDLGPFSANLINAANPNLTSGGLLQSGSNAINAGTSNPLGQGAGVCSLSDGVRTINCALDALGNPRGAAWDIGWNEFVSTGPGDPPPAPPIIDRGDKGTP